MGFAADQPIPIPAFPLKGKEKSESTSRGFRIFDACRNQVTAAVRAGRYGGVAITISASE